MSIRAVIVDDEELARRGLRKRLERTPDVEVVAECRNGREAIEALRRMAPDLVFLDVQMPGKSGFDVVEAIGWEACPHIVFVTAYDRHALRAFQVNALDYLLKPIDDERLEVALHRVREALARKQDSEFGHRLAALLAATGRTSSQPERLVVRCSGRVVFVRVREIDWVEAAGDYVTLHCGKKSWLMRETLSALKSKLGSQFARIHRSSVVNLERIVELKPLDNGEYLVLLQNGTQLKLSRSYRDALPQLLGTSA